MRKLEIDAYQPQLFTPEPQIQIPSLSLTPPQRESIRERDNHECQGCGIATFCPRDVPERVNVQVHHILPRGFARKFGVDPNFPENLITICENLHVGHPTLSIHPDTYQAKMTYSENRNSFIDMSAHRQELIDKRTAYWNTTYDRPLQTIAIRNTQHALAEGWRFPYRKDQVYYIEK